MRDYFYKMLYNKYMKNNKIATFTENTRKNSADLIKKVKKHQKSTLRQKAQYTFDGFKVAIKEDWSFLAVGLIAIFGLSVVVIKGLGIVWFVIVFVAGLRDIQAENNNSITEDICDMFGQDVLVELKGKKNDRDRRIKIIKDRSSLSAFMNHFILGILIIVALII